MQFKMHTVTYTQKCFGVRNFTAEMPRKTTQDPPHTFSLSHTHTHAEYQSHGDIHETTCAEIHIKTLTYMKIH